MKRLPTMLDRYDPLDGAESAQQALGEATPRSSDLDRALGELYRRLREQAQVEDVRLLRAVLDRLRNIYGTDDDDVGGGAGVREPRRQPPSGRAAGINLAA